MRRNINARGSFETKPSTVQAANGAHIPAQTHQMLPAASERDSAVSALLSDDDKQCLERCEAMLARGLSTFLEVGKALVTIRDSRLYRATHATFEMYCQQRWGIGRAYAWRVIGAAQRVNLLPKTLGIPLPVNEFQMRPFLRREPELFPKLWAEVTKRVNARPMTSSLVESILQEISDTKGDNKTHEVRVMTRELPAHSRLGHVLALLQDVRRKLEKAQTDQALEVLERIEYVLCEK